jgi:hypothetical protein
MCERDAIPLGASQESHGITIDQLDVRQVDGDDTAILQRVAQDIQVFPLNPTADAKHDTLFNREPVDSARHGRMACCLMPRWANGTPAAVR